MVEKLSQFSVSGSPPGPTDTIVGGKAGSNLLYTLTQMSVSQGWVNVKDYGAIADGGSHPLSDFYGSLAGAQLVYPFATSLTQQIDYCAAQLASNIAFGSPPNAASTNLNLRVRINAGIYFFGSDTWKISNLYSGVIQGDGKLVSTLTGNSIVFQTDGCWYTKFSEFTVQALSAGTVAFDLDGNVAGTGATNTVQGCTFENILTIGGGSTYAFAMCRQGGDTAQGSERLFLNCHFQSGANACYYQNGFNAIDNVFIGGDMQSYQTNGIFVTQGNVHVYGTSFESTYGYLQFTNNGYDIRVGDGGAGEGCCIYGCRSESMRFFHNGGAVFADIRGISGALAGFGAWAPSTHYNLGDAILNLTTGKVYVATVAGTSGLSQPNFPVDGFWTGSDGLTGSTVVDGGTLTWQENVYHFIYNPSQQGTVDFNTCVSDAGLIDASAESDYRTFPAITADFSFQDYQNSRPNIIPDFLPVNATSGAVNITLPYLVVGVGRRILVKKIDGTAHPVNIFGGNTVSQETGTQPETILSPYGYREYVFDTNPSSVRTWNKIAQDDGWGYISANYQFVNPGDKLLVDTSGGVVTIKIFNTPEGVVPVTGQSFKVKDATGSFATHNLTIDPHGGTINSSGSSYVSSTNNAALELVWVNSSIGWKVYTD